MSSSPARDPNEEALARKTARFRAYQRRASIPLMVTGFVFIAAFIVQVWDHDLFSRWLLIVTWAVFVADYVVMLFLAPRKWDFIRHNLLMLIALALPPLRVVLLVSITHRTLRSAHSPLRNRVGLLALYVTTLIVLFGALIVWRCERGQPGANIETYGESLWWAVVSVTTVGYGDYVPVTLPGRLVATIVFLNGIAALSVLTGVVVGTFSADARKHGEGESASTARGDSSDARTASPDSSDPVHTMSIPSRGHTESGSSEAGSQQVEET